MTQSLGRFRIGTSGYHYDHWAGSFYPADLPKSDWFAHYADVFDTVEINNTFYRLPDIDTFDAWRERAPQGFLYALKFSRYGTHMKHLKDPEGTIGLFMERAWRLGPHLGPVLVQIPPHWKVDPERLRDFLASTPDEIRWVIEVRNATWLHDTVFAVLRQAGAALCVHDLLENHPWMVTTDWMYLRYHGIGYGGAYAHQRLSADADRVAHHLRSGRDVYAYFNNDIGGHAIRDADRFRRFVATRCDRST